jgi:L-aspartate oxidase
MPDCHGPWSESESALKHWRTSVVVVGSGVAGLTCALALAPLPVLLLTKTPMPQGGSSVWAQGGIAASVGRGDTAESHAADTVEAGAGLVDADRALLLARDGADAVRGLIEAGVPFDRGKDGEVVLGREAAHSAARIVHSGGDTTGRNLIRSLIEMAAATPSIRIVPGCVVVELIRQHGRVAGLLAFQAEDGWVQVHANHVVLATGGIGALWRATTNPTEATGDGLALAARAGAQLADLEFVQFHPTALLPNGHSDGARLPLLTEALRGAGALLLDAQGRRFMPEEHPLAELAPRDIVARAIARRAAAGETVLLDLRPALAARGEASFPQALSLCRGAGYEPLREPVPITPAAHYHMGGVVTDERGRSSVTGLWACGEVAMTGVHGANRLASNSLLEGLVFGRRVAADIRQADPWTQPAAEPRHTPPSPACVPPVDAMRLRDTVRRLMASHVGIVRDADGLRAVADGLVAVQTRLDELAATGGSADFATLLHGCELRNMLTVARLVTLAAARREESRGAHCRSDFPEAREEWRHRQVLGLADLDAGEGAAEPRSRISAC